MKTTQRQEPRRGAGMVDPLSSYRPPREEQGPSETSRLELKVTKRHPTSFRVPYLQLSENMPLMADLSHWSCVQSESKLEVDGWLSILWSVLGPLNIGATLY